MKQFRSVAIVSVCVLLLLGSLAGMSNHPVAAIELAGEAAATGVVPGTITEDLTLSSGEYDLPVEVYVLNHATLTVGTGVVLNGGRILTRPSPDGVSGLGTIAISGATLRGTRLDFDFPGSSLVDSTLEKRSQLDLRTDYSIAGNTFIDSAVYISPGFDTNPIVYLHNNEFYTASIGIGFDPPGATTDVTIGSNSGSLSLSAHGAAKIKIEDNDFSIRTHIQLYSTDQTLVRRNVFTDIGNVSSVVIGGTGPFTVEDNRFESTQVWTKSNYGGYAAIVVDAATPPDDASGGVIRNNFFSGQQVGIDLRGDVTTEVSRNQLIKNYNALIVGGNGTPTIGNNCMAGNGTKGGYPDGFALFVYNRTTRLDVGSNFWGHPSGPVHAENPGGLGDHIRDDAGLVDLQPILTTCDVDAKDLWPGGMEVVQVIQTLDNSVPLVAGKPTLVRVYPHNSPVGAMPGVTGRLTAYRNGTALKPVLSPVAPAIAATPGMDWDIIRGSSDHSLDFRLPDDWCHGTLQVAVEVNPGPNRQVEETVYTNNSMTRTLTFHAQKVPRVAIVPIKYGEKKRLAPTVGMMAPTMDFARTIFPVRQIDFFAHPAIPGPSQLGEDRRQEGQVLVTQLKQMLTKWNQNRPEGERIDYLLGLILPNQLPNVFFARGENIAWTENDISIATALFSYLVAFPRSNKQIPRWPHGDDSIQEYGYDMRYDKIVPRTTKDLSRNPSRGKSTWISPYHYGMLFVALGPGQASRSARLVAQKSYLMVGGWVAKDGNMEFSPAWQLTSTTDIASPPSTSGEYCLDLLGAEGAALHTHCFEMAFIRPLSEIPLDVDGFFAVLPFAEGTNAVALRQGNTELGRITASANPPTLISAPVQNLQATGVDAQPSQVALHWAGADADGDALHYTVLYSTDDGATWLPVQVDGTDTSFVLDLAQVPSGGSALVRVEASDGFHTTHIDIGPFAAADAGPWVGIESPVHLSSVSLPLRLEGSAYDMEDDAFIDEGLLWQSDRDGELGSGNVLTVTALSPGEHTLTLSAADSQGHTNRASIVVSTQPIVDTAIVGLSAQNDGPSTQGTLTRLSATLDTGTHCTFAWDFGDGATGSGEAADHLYAQTGSYTATVTARNGMGEATATTQVQVVEVTDPPAQERSLYLPAVRR